MNARQKAKQLKKQLAALYEDYVTSGIMTEQVMNVVAGNMQKMRDQQVTCSVENEYFDPVEIDDDIAIELWEKLTYHAQFRQAVVFEGYTDPDTGKYILEAKLTVVMPEVEKCEED